MADKKAGMMEGAPYNCGIHDFTTTDPEAWFQHCEDPANVHVEDVNGPCIFCGTPVQVLGLPWKRPDKPKGVVCDNCKVNQLGASADSVKKANKKNAPKEGEV